MRSINTTTRKSVSRTKPRSPRMWKTIKRWLKRNTRRTTNSVNSLRRKSGFRRICSSRTHKNCSNSVRRKPISMVISSPPWLPLATFRAISASWTRNSNANKNSSTTRNIRSNWWNAKWRKPVARKRSKRRKISRRRSRPLKRNINRSSRTTNCSKARSRSSRKTCARSKKVRPMCVHRRRSIKRWLTRWFWKTTWLTTIFRKSPKIKKKCLCDTTAWSSKLRKSIKFSNKLLTKFTIYKTERINWKWANKSVRRKSKCIEMCSWLRTKRRRMSVIKLL